MVIERINNEIVIRLPADIDTTGFKQIAKYIKCKNAIKKSVQREEQINLLADESKKRWWDENKAKYIK